MTLQPRSLAMLLALLAACGAPALNSAPAVTDVGTAAGHPATAQLGPDGGTITSSDGLVTLTVPPGALSQSATFGVDALTATAPGAVRAYRLSPEGTTFAVPATITFQLGADDLVGTTTSAFSVGYQDAQHQWRLLSNATVSSYGTQISVSTGHLSDWSLVRGWQLKPGKATVKPGGSLTLVVTYCNVVDVGSPGEELYTAAAECEPTGRELSLPVMRWSVNGTVGGGGSSGTVDQGNPAANYQAPSQALPSAVAVSVEFGVQRVKSSKVLLVSNVSVIDDTPPAGFTGTVHLDSKAGGPGTATTQLDYTGHATVRLTQDFTRSARSYALTGELAVDSATIELGPCLCTSTGGAGSLEGELSYSPSTEGTGGEYSLSLNGEPTVGLTCSPTASGADCPSRNYPFTIAWALDPSIPATCTGSTTDTYADISSIEGSQQETCQGAANTRDTVSWSFAATNNP